MLNKITGYGSVKSASGVKKSGRTKSVGAFEALLGLAGTDEPAPVTQLSDVAAAAAVDNMLSLQEISEDDVRRKKLVQQGRNMLDALENLRRQLLAGGVSIQTLQDLNRQLSIKKQSVNDLALAALLDDIELRVAVELAKLEKTASGT